MKTKRGIYWDLYETEYYYDLDGLRYYFSSEFYKNKFITKVKDYVNTETLKLVRNNHVACNFDLYFQLSFYSRTEKRGFRVVDLSNNKQLYPKDIIINTVTFRKN